MTYENNIAYYFTVPDTFYGPGKAQVPESYYRDNWCAGRGQTEIVLPDHTRCDCLTPTHAVEVDFAPKFYEAIGQSLYYSLQTGRKAGIVLILEKRSDYKYWLRLNSVIEHFKLPIDTWIVREVLLNLTTGSSYVESTKAEPF